MRQRSVRSTRESPERGGDATRPTRAAARDREPSTKGRGPTGTREAETRGGPELAHKGKALAKAVTTWKALLLVLATTLAVCCVSDLVKIADLRARVTTSEEPHSLPILLIPTSEALVIWDIICLQLLHVPAAWLSTFGCTVLPLKQDSPYHVWKERIASTREGRNSPIPQDNPDSPSHIPPIVPSLSPSPSVSPSKTVPSTYEATPMNTSDTDTKSSLRWTSSVETLVAHMGTATTALNQVDPTTFETKLTGTYERLNTPTSTPEPPAAVADELPMPCIFCGISENPEEKSRKVYEDENYVAFHDINPSARLHILIVPRRHIENVMSLSIKDINMIREMKALGHMLLAKNQVPLKDHHLGFHVPPFTSVPHLHLHVIARPFKNWVRSAKYPEAKSWWLSTGSSVSESIFGKGRWIRWWVHVNDLLAALEAAEERGDSREFSWEFFSR